MNVLRVVVMGIAAAATWWLGVVVVFGPAQVILADPERQSAKFLRAFADEPLPRMAENPLALPIGLLGIGLVYASAYAWLGGKLSGPAWRRGLVFGGLAWALMVPWFEFYLPWSVMREPLPLVLLEGVCWLIVLLGVGTATAFVHRLVHPRTVA